MKKEENLPQEIALEHEYIIFEQSSMKLIKNAREEMIENSRNEKRVYHTQEHPDALLERAEKIANIFDLTNHQKLLCKLAIAYHDLIILTDLPDPGNITATIKRHRGAREGDLCGQEGNEGQSAKKAELAMRQINESYKSTVFSEEDIKIVFSSIEATYPDTKLTTFKSDPDYEEIIKINPKREGVITWLEERQIDKGLLFFQPHLEKPLEKGELIPFEVLVMILADLSGSGLVSRDEFALEGDKEFQELYVNIANPDKQKILLESDSEKDEALREKASLEILKWLNIQVGFVAWQMLRIEKIIFLLIKNKQINPLVGEKLRSIFNKFENNIKDSFERANHTDKEYLEIKENKGSKSAFAYLLDTLHFKRLD